MHDPLARARCGRPCGTPCSAADGFIDGVTDGVEIKIECIDVTIVAPDFLGTIHIIHVSLASCDENWVRPCLFFGGFFDEIIPRT